MCNIIENDFKYHRPPHPCSILPHAPEALYTLIYFLSQECIQKGVLNLSTSSSIGPGPFDRALTNCQRPVQLILEIRNTRTVYSPRGVWGCME